MLIDLLKGGCTFLRALCPLFSYAQAMPVTRASCHDNREAHETRAAWGLPWARPFPTSVLPVPLRVTELRSSYCNSPAVTKPH